MEVTAMAERARPEYRSGDKRVAKAKPDQLRLRFNLKRSCSKAIGASGRISHASSAAILVRGAGQQTLRGCTKTRASRIISYSKRGRARWLRGRSPTLLPGTASA